MFKNVAAKFMVYAFDSTTGLPKTGDSANITAYVSKDYGTVTALGDTSATEMDSTNAKGYYLFDAAQAETNADCLMVSGKSSTSNIVVIGAPAVIYTRPTTGWLAPATAGRTLVVDASGLADANVVKVGPSGSGTAQTAGDIIGDTNDIQTRLPAALVSGRIDASVGAMAANVITAAATAADYLAEINAEADTAISDAALATAANLATLTGYVDTEVAAIKTVTDKLDNTVENTSDGYIFTANALQNGPSGSGPTAADIADAVWEEAIADHSGTTGSTAEQLAAAGAAGDPWATDLPGSYTSGKAGYLLGTYVNASIAAVKAKTDNLPSDPADASDISTSFSAVVSAIDALPTATENADALLNRDMSSVTDSTARSPLNALRFLRNKWSISGTTLTVTKEDDSTSAWTATVSTTAGADPVTGNDPA